MPPIIRDWLESKVVSISKQEIIDKYPTYNGKSNHARITRARLSVAPSIDPSKNAKLVVSLQQDDGRWSERRGVMKWQMGHFYDRTERYDVFVATTKLQYKGWTSGAKTITGFLRIGRQGAVFIMPAGVRTSIAEPPSFRQPPTHLRNLQVGSDGYLAATAMPNPAYADWEEWMREVSVSLDFCQRRAEITGLRVDPAEYAKSRLAICHLCGIHANQSADPQADWRIVDKRFYCDRCNATRITS